MYPFLGKCWVSTPGNFVWVLIYRHTTLGMDLPWRASRPRAIGRPVTDPGHSRATPGIYKAPGPPVRLVIASGRGPTPLSPEYW